MQRYERDNMARESVVVNRTFEKIAALQANVEQVIRGKADVVQYCIAALLAKGHILLEDVPGVGKTTLAHALARSLSLSFQRIQFTSDLLPADIVGVTIFNQDHQEFEFVSGPIFTNVLLADEINRATPKSQSALLEAMSEGMISIEKRRLPLPDPFLVIATQNPVEHVGTYPLPESQLDRFLMRLTIGYPNSVDEKKLTPGLAENVFELCNVLTSLLNREGGPHIKLHQVIYPGMALPNDARAHLLALGRRLDLMIEVSRYGKGKFSLSLAP